MTEMLKTRCPLMQHGVLLIGESGLIQRRRV